MTDTDHPRFLAALAEMERLFRETLTDVARQLYWRLLAERCTLDEWEYATTEAMARETFAHVPLPGMLMDYVREYRQGVEVAS